LIKLCDIIWVMRSKPKGGASGFNFCLLEEVRLNAS
jgi:hypothetical protein